MKVTSIHFNPQIKPALNHNDRTDSRAPNIYKDLSHNNEYSRTAKETRELIDKYYNEALEILKARKTKRKTEKERSYTEAIIEIQEHHNMQDLKQLSKEIAELTGFRPLQISIHRDEGHTDEHGEFKIHHHAHIVFFTLDKETGKQLARQQASLSKENLKKMQTLTAKILNMKRGKEGSQRQYFTFMKDYKVFAEKDKELKIKEKQLDNRDIKQNERQEQQDNRESEINDKEHNISIREAELDKSFDDYEKEQKMQEMKKQGILTFTNELIHNRILKKPTKAQKEREKLKYIYNSVAQEKEKKYKEKIQELENTIKDRDQTIQTITKEKEKIQANGNEQLKILRNAIKILKETLLNFITKEQIEKLLNPNKTRETPQQNKQQNQGMSR